MKPLAGIGKPSLETQVQTLTLPSTDLVTLDRYFTPAKRVW